MHFAHTLPSRGPADWEPLDLHLNEVANFAAAASAKFGAEDWGRLAGRWHDLGKYSAAFQNYLRGPDGTEAHVEAPTRVDHSTAGAQHAVRKLPRFGRLLAYVIAGHHAGLGDALKLDERLTKSVEPWNAAPASLVESLPLGDPLLSFDANDRNRSGFQLAFFTRMLFSSLVDADYLATERFMDPERARRRPDLTCIIGEMLAELDRYMDALVEASLATTVVNERRQEVLNACRNAATMPPGAFSLTVPTGGGKTLASLSFALRHALQHNLQRVIYAIPFTSIIEQTADVFRSVFARLKGELVLEHHSNLEPSQETARSRLAAENWDAPLIVTTNVQLFESLFAARTSQCRKLHNLVGSVIVLDEAQSLPVELLRPCLAALRELTADYHVSIVLCTATQPALLYRDDFAIGLKDVREIILDRDQLYDDLKRVEAIQIGAQTNQALADRLADEPQALCIVNTRRHAAELFSLLRAKVVESDGHYHLSTLMCGEHRSAMLKTIRQRLADGLPCRVISTQLIEAGVDIDFPVVYRSIAGLDSIAQAAGRCNREGRLNKGRVSLFTPIDNPLAIGYIRSCADSTAEVAPDYPTDLLQPSAIEAYFQLHYWNQHQVHQCDKPGVMRRFPAPNGRRIDFDFRSAADAFRMIDNMAQQVFVPYDARAERLIEELRYGGPTRDVMRSLQRYTVGLYDQTFRAMVVAGDIELIEGEFAILANGTAYDREMGLRTDRPGFYEPESLVC